MDTQIAPAVTADIKPATPAHIDTIQRLVLAGDLSKMGPKERVTYYMQLCESLKLNPYTQPFQILRLSGKEVLYATKSCSEQLRKKQGVSVTKMEHRVESGIMVVTCSVKDKSGRTDISTGAVVVDGLRGESLANAYMKCETKAKRRATLSICGLGMLDESELDTIKGAEKVEMPALEPEQETSATVVVEPQAPAPRPTPPAAPVASAPASAPQAVPAGADQSSEDEEPLAKAYVLDLLKDADTLDELRNIWQGEARPYQLDVDVLAAKESRKNHLQLNQTLTA